MVDDNLRYTGIPNPLNKRIGSVVDASRTEPSNPISTIDVHAELTNALLAIISKTNNIISSAEEYMADIAVQIPVNSLVRKAQAVEWPSELGTPSNTISYGQYTAMDKKSTLGSDLIQKHFYDSLSRTVDSSMVDGIRLAKLVNTEAKHMKVFAESNLKQYSNAGPSDLYRILISWADGATVLTQQLELLLDPTIDSEYDPTELDELSSISSSKAKKLQSTMFGKINSLNNSIDIEMQSLERQFGDSSSRYYNEIFGPAVKIGEEAISLSDMMADSVIDNTKKELSRGYSAKARVLASDQIVRNRNFLLKAGTIIDLTVQKYQHIKTVELLAAKGSTVQTAVIRKPINKDHEKYFKEYKGSEEDIFLASHNSLDGVLDDEAHPQYILKSGGKISGNLDVEAGVTVDGVSISNHTHSGLDGSKKITSDSIEEGSLTSATVDRAESVPAPKSVTVGTKTVRTESTTTLVDVALEWEGDPSTTFEVQIAAVLPVVPVDVLNKLSIIAPPATPSFTDVPESAIFGTTGYVGLSNFYNTSDEGSTWYYFLSEESDPQLSSDNEDGSISAFRSYGDAGASGGNYLYMHAASIDNYTYTLRTATIRDTSYTMDRLLPEPYYRGQSWVLRNTTPSISVIMAAGDKLFKIQDEIVTAIKDYESTSSNSSQIYAMAIDYSNSDIYFLVKTSVYSDSFDYSSNTTIALNKLDIDDNITELYVWDNQQEIDKLGSDGESLWLKGDITQKDYNVSGVGVCENGYIYWFSHKSYTTPTSEDKYMALSKFDLSKFSREFVLLGDGSNIISVSDQPNHNQVPVPIVVNGTIYLPGNCVSTGEILTSNAAPTNSFLVISDSGFTRKFVTTPDRAKGTIRSISRDFNGGIYGMFVPSIYSSGDYATIYQLDGA